MFYFSPPKAPAGEIRPITAPIDRTGAALRRGDDARVDVVVRTRKVGHFFPGGTVDAFDVWLEVQATDEKGQVIFWSGKVRSEEHTSELQSPCNLVCRLLLEKKKK